MRFTGNSLKDAVTKIQLCYSTIVTKPGELQKRIHFELTLNYLSPIPISFVAVASPIILRLK